MSHKQWKTVAANLGLIHKMLDVCGVVRDGPLWDECYDRGFDCLCRAARAFDPKRGYRFSTLACMAIRRGIRQIKKRRANRNRLTVPIDSSSRRVPPAFDTAPDGETLETLAALLPALSDRQRYVLYARAVDGRILDEIGAEIGLSKERIRQIQNDAISRARQCAEKAGML